MSAFMSLWRGAYAASALLALLFSLPAVVEALVDPADTLDGGLVTAYSNLEVASNEGVDLATFNGDTGRYVRAARGRPSFLNYTDASKIQGVEIAFFANSESLASGTWQITLATGLPDGSWLDIGSIFSARTIGDELPGSSGPTVRLCRLSVNCVPQRLQAIARALRKLRSALAQQTSRRSARRSLGNVRPFGVLQIELCELGTAFVRPPTLFPGSAAELSIAPSCLRAGGHRHAHVLKGVAE